MVKQFDKCCCTSLRTGTIIIGVLGLIGGLYYTAKALFNVSATHNSKDDMPGGSAASIVQVIMGIFNIIISILLIVGAVKRNAKMVYPFIVVSVVMLVLFIIITVAGGIYACIQGLIGVGLTLFFSTLIVALIDVYLILIVNSFYNTLKNGDPAVAQHA